MEFHLQLYFHLPENHPSDIAQVNFIFRFAGTIKMLCTVDISLLLLVFRFVPSNYLIVRLLHIIIISTKIVESEVCLSLCTVRLGLERTTV